MKVYYLIRNVQLVDRLFYIAAVGEMWFTQFQNEAKQFHTRSDAADFLEQWMKDRKTEFYLFEVVKIFDVSALVKKDV